MDSHILFILNGYLSKNSSNPKDFSREIQKCLISTSKKVGIKKEQVRTIVSSLYFICVYSTEFSSYTEDLADRIDNMSYEQIENLSNDYVSTEVLFDLINFYGYVDIDHLKNVDSLLRFYKPSDTWLLQQLIYSENLTDFETRILHLYTYKGDRFINSYLRQNNKFSSENVSYVIKNIKIFNKFMKIDKIMAETEILRRMNDFAQLFIRTLSEIIDKAPSVDKEFIVYRGKQELYRVDRVPEVFTSLGFVSTSILLDVALDFAIDDSMDPDKSDLENLSRNDYMYLEKIIVPVGAKVMLNNIHSYYEMEQEVLFPIDSTFKVLKECKDDLKMIVPRGYDTYQPARGKTCLVEYLL
jgi:hypothetical protein